MERSGVSAINLGITMEYEVDYETINAIDSVVTGELTIT